MLNLNTPSLLMVYWRFIFGNIKVYQCCSSNGVLILFLDPIWYTVHLYFFLLLLLSYPLSFKAKTKLKRINDRILYFKFFFRIIIMIIIINRHDFSLVLLFSFIDYLMINLMWIL